MPSIVELFSRHRPLCVLGYGLLRSTSLTHGRVVDSLGCFYDLSSCDATNGRQKLLVGSRVPCTGNRSEHPQECYWTSGVGGILTECLPVSWSAATTSLRFEGNTRFLPIFLGTMGIEVRSFACPRGSLPLESITCIMPARWTLWERSTWVSAGAVVE